MCNQNFGKTSPRSSQLTKAFNPGFHIDENRALLIDVRFNFLLSDVALIRNLYRVSLVQISTSSAFPVRGIMTPPFLLEQ